MFSPILHEILQAQQGSWGYLAKPGPIRFFLFYDEPGHPPIHY
jgi:hypothetical protein